MIVIVEGADGVGKTTLINQLRQLTYCHVLASSGPPPDFDAVIEELGWLSHFPRSLFLICDRYRLISEPIYGPILRGKSFVGAFNRHLLAEAEVDAIVYCRPKLATIVENVRRTKALQLNGVWEHLPEIVEGYDRLFEYLEEDQTDTRVLSYDYEVHTAEYLLKRLKEPTDGSADRDI